MFKQLKFAHKIMIMPLLALGTLFLLFFVSRFFMQQNDELLLRVKSNFVPALELGWELEKTLTALQHGLQDAVNTADEEELEMADTLYEGFLSLFETGVSNPSFEQESLQHLKSKFQIYYTLARETSLRLIEGENLTEQLIDNLEVMNEQYNGITQKLQAMAEQAKEDVSRSFDATLDNQRRSALFMNMIIFCFAILLGSISIVLGRSLTNPLNKVIYVANQFTEGKNGIRVRINSSDEIGILALSINNMMDKIEQQNWLKSGQAVLNERMRGEQDIPSLSRTIISYLSEYVNAQVGALYLYNECEQTLQLTGSYAYSQRKGNHNAVKLGEGLVGQAALEQQRILFQDIPDDYIKINSGLGEASPRNILVIPFVYEHALKGVLEIGSAYQFTQRHLVFLDQVAESVAITFNSVQARARMQTLLDETQQQSETLRTQQKKLQQTNEELEEQTQSLRISEEKLQAQQEELQQTNEELGEQTRILERQKQELGEKNQELEQARQLVEEKARDLELSSKYKSEFLANMSHELRTPLNSLLILSQLLSENKNGNLTPKQCEFASTIHNAGSDLLELINEILDLSKLEAGKMTLNLEEMSLKGFASYITQTFTHVAEQKNLFLKVTLADGLPPSIRTDRQRVEQIAKNFLSNALKFTKNGGVSVHIDRVEHQNNELGSQFESQHTIAISVTDTGIGISEDKQRLIFEAFQQADGTTSRRYGGTGLGLSISRELVKLLEGEIHLRSQEGEGSTFTLYLPEQLSQESESGQHEKQNAPEEKQAQTLEAGEERHATPLVSASTPEASLPETGIIRDDRHGTISPTDKFLLIIEDDPKFAKILFDLTRERGFKALIANDGAAGLQLAYQHKPKAIILDIGLPGVCGWTVMDKLKMNSETRHIPVHVISALDRSLDALKMGAIGYLKKPVTLEKLNDTFTTIEESLVRTLKKVLIVENDQAVRTSMQDLLSGQNVAITTVENGQEAYETLKTDTFDCMVLDLELAARSGFDVLNAIKMDSTIRDLPIIAYAGQESTKEDKMYLKRYAESILIKDVTSPERLLDEVTLFLHQVADNLPEAQQNKLRMLHGQENVFEGRTILIADDDIRNVFALSSALEEKGLDILIAENGQETLDQLESHPQIDLILMDIMMPEMDGYEVIKLIRQTPKFRKLPVLALTAKAMKGDRQKCLDAGANDYLSKPVDTEKLLSLLRVWLY